MSILNIKERFSKRILEEEEDAKQIELQGNGSTAKIAESAGNDVQEADVGITEFVSDLPGFHAIIKHRFSDFNVHEIDVDGNVAILNCFELPDEKPVDTCISPPPLEDSVLSDLEKLVSGDESATPVSINVTDKSKDDRKAIHQFVKKKYGSAVVSSTKEDEDTKFIVIAKYLKDRRYEGHPSHLPKFLHFIMSKSNTDTSEAFSLLACKLRARQKDFAFSGTKDKRGNTSQWVSAKLLLASKLIKVNESLRNIKVGNFVYKDYALYLGDLKGNNFQIALRNVTTSDEEIDHAVKQLKERGFINYYGLQRFGKSSECPTHEIGRQIIKEAYGAAVELILKPRRMTEAPELKQAREIWAKTRNPGQALSSLRNRNSVEGKLLQGLKKNGPTAFVNALDMVPRSVRRLYLHSYQSLVWNKVASLRIKKYGLQILEGDLVLVDKSYEAPLEYCEEVDAVPDADATTDPTPTKPCAVKILSAADVTSYTIYDIVLPLPGVESVYPGNEQANWYKEILSKDGLSLTSFSSPTRDYVLQGAYRKIVERPNNLTWKIVRYSKPDDDLILSDSDILEGKVLPEHPDGPLKALVLSFDLGSCTYATMALREILRSDTSASHQIHLRNSERKRLGEEMENVPAKRRKNSEGDTSQSVDHSE